MKKLNIMIVDDSREIRQLVVATLDPDRYDVREAADAGKALQMCAENPPDVVVMDLKMPGELDGIDATRRLKADPITAGSTVLMLSGFGGSDQIATAIAAGASDFLVKPFSPLELIEKIERSVSAGH